MEYSLSNYIINGPSLRNDADVTLSFAVGHNLVFWRLILWTRLCTHVCVCTCVRAQGWSAVVIGTDAVTSCAADLGSAQASAPGR